MTLRSPQERMFQTLMFEAGGLCLAVPAYMVAMAGDAGHGALLMAALSVAVMLWSPLHNTAFDLMDLRLSGRVASERPQRLRVLHALSHEVSSVAVTLPIMVLAGGHTVAEALSLNLMLTLLYAAYAYVFHLAYDRVRPIDATACAGGAAR